MTQTSELSTISTELDFTMKEVSLTAESITEAIAESDRALESSSNEINQMETNVRELLKKLEDWPL